MIANNDFPILRFKQYSLEQPITLDLDTFDLFCVLSGKIKVTFRSEESAVYNKQDLFILHQHRPCSIEPVANNLIMQMSLSPIFVQKYLGTDSGVFCDSVLEPNRNYYPLRNLLASMYSKYVDDAPTYELSLYSELFQMLDILKKYFTLQLPATVHCKSSKQFDRLLEIQDYISQNYTQAITLSTLAEHLHLTPQYLSKFFKESFHIKFSTYVNSFRIQLAERELCHSTEHITEIALNHGFPNVATFNKHFRNTYGLSPREYRKQHQTPEPPVLRENDVNKRNVYLNTDVDRVNREIHIDAKRTSKFTQNLSELINIGFAKKLLSGHFQAQVLSSQEDLNFRYIRMEGLISNALIPKLLTQNEYYLSSIETILNFLYQHQIIPFIELGKNSYDYQQNSFSALSFRSYCNTPKFHGMLESFLQFVTTHYDPSWYNQWIFELRKSPDEDLSTYISGYQAIEHLIHQYIPSAAFGGPGHNTGQSSPTELIDCLSAFYEHGITPDFISIHLYYIQRTGTGNQDRLIVPPDPDVFLSQQSWILRKMNQFLPRQCPLYITELNSVLIPHTFINASCYQATFLCHTLLHLHEKSPLIGYWMLSDMNVHIAAPDNSLFDGIGLINRNSIKMPSYHAYCLLGKLGSRLLEQAPDYCVTQTDDYHYQILAYHYSHFSDFSFLGEERQSLRHVYKHFDKKQPMEMVFHLEGIQPGTYRIKRYLLDRFHGSYLDIQLGELINSTIDEESFFYKNIALSPQQMDYLTSACIPEERTVYLQTGEELTVSSPIFPHNICLWEVTKEL